jgi:hypothetical protein
MITEWIQEHRRLTEADRRGARLAELHHIAALAADAALVVQHGWASSSWYGPDGQACLVGAVVRAAGGPRAARSQVVRRTIDLVWHTLRRDGTPPGDYCPAPVILQMRVRDLTRWNDSPGRTAAEVVALLAATRAVAVDEAHRLRGIPVSA